MTITLELKDRVQKLLNELAEDSGISIGEFALSQFETMIEREYAIRKATNYVLTKNQELYERLAR